MLAGSRRAGAGAWRAGGRGGGKHTEALTSRSVGGREEGERCEEGKVNWVNSVSGDGGSLPRDS